MAVLLPARHATSWQLSNRPFLLAPRVTSRAARPVQARTNLVQRRLAKKQLAAHQKMFDKQTVGAVHGNTSAAEQKEQARAFLENMYLPGTFILPPLKAYLGRPRDLAGLLWFWAKTRLADLAVVLTMSRNSARHWYWGRAAIPATARSFVPIAKNLHRSMSEALAAGDKAVLPKYCIDALANKLQAGIDARPRGRVYLWELVRYKGAPSLYPRVVSNRIAPMVGHGAMDGVVPQARKAIASVTKDRVVRQVVVAIKSRQRLTQNDMFGGRTRPVEGYPKEVELLEYVVLKQVIDTKTWDASEWKLYGTVQPTTPEGWAEEQRKVHRLQQASLRGAR